jgi:hypothetical protein
MTALLNSLLSVGFTSPSLFLGAFYLPPHSWSHTSEQVTAENASPNSYRYLYPEAQNTASFVTSTP